MGWLYGWNSRERLIKHLTDENGLQTIASKTASEDGQAILWAVHQIRADHEREEYRGRRFIACYLLGGSGNGPQSHGYKDMDESVHPYYYSCPLSYLDLAPIVDCQEWRDKVKLYHWQKGEAALKLRMLQVGEVVKLKDGCKPPELTITQTKPKLLGEYNGMVYRVTPRYLAL